MNQSGIEILYEDNHLLAVNKPAGMLVQGDQTSDKPLIELGKAYIKVRYEKPGNVFLGLCHRLDRPVSGVVLMARTSKALSRINALFARHEINKTYLAITDRKIHRTEGQIVQWLDKDASRNRVKAHTSPREGARKAITNYRLIGSLMGRHLFLLEPLTGRSHQLRLAMQTLGCPILGDVKYGGSKSDPKSICLHAYQLSFVHPVSVNSLRITAPLPLHPDWNGFQGLL